MAFLTGEKTPVNALHIAVLFLTLIGVFILSLTKVVDYDLWFHLKTGEHIVKNLVIPKTDIFSYTAYGHEWITHEWLFEAILYLLYAVSGLWGIGLMKAMTIAALFAVYLIHLRKTGVSPFISAPVIAIAAVLARERYIERPELVTYLFSAVYIVLLEKFRRDENKGSRYLWALPALMVFWANSHSGAIFAIIILGSYGLGAIMDAFRGKDSWGKVKTLVIIGLITLLAGFLNPNTYHVYTYPFLALKISRETGLNLAEYTPPTWGQDHLFFIFFAVAAVILLVNIRRANPAHYLLFAVFSISAFRYNRNIAMWAFIAAPYVPVAIEGIRERFFRDRGTGRAIVPAAASFILVVAAIVPFLWSGAATGSIGTGIKGGKFPEGAIRFLEANGIKGNMYNSYEFGGYFIWRTPDKKVYIDGRSDIYTELLTDQRMLSALGFENIIEKYGINYAVLSFKQSNVDYINPDPYFGEGIALVYWDDVALVYLKRTPENQPIIDKYEYRAVRPTDTRFQFTRAPLEEITRELERNVSENPSGWRNHMLLANAYGAMGMLERAASEAEAFKANRARPAL